MNTVLKGSVLALAMVPVSVEAATVLSLDLSVANKLTITAGPGLSAITASGTDFTGIYLDQFFAGPASSGFSYSLDSGNFTNANNPSDNSPQLYRANAADLGLNIWSFSSDAVVNFTSGTLAFTGSATWSLSASTYTDMLAGSTTGSLFFAADSADDIPGASIIGEWAISAPVSPVPLPPAVLLLGSALAGFGVYARRRKTHDARVPA